MDIIEAAKVDDTDSIRENWECKYYCEDEDKPYRIEIPMGVSCEEFFKNKPKCPMCGNANIAPVYDHRPEGFEESKKNQNN